MKQNNTVKIILGIGIFLVGCALTVAILYRFPNLYSKIGGTLTRIDKKVTITDNGIADSVEKVYDAVVVVSVYKDDQIYASGTGFVYKKDGNKAYILTNNHVVSGASKVSVTFTSGKVVETDVVGSDELSDIAVLSLKASDIISVAEIGKSDDIRVGDTTFAVGAPVNSVYSWTVTRGIISGKDRMIEVTISSNAGDYVMKAIQTDAAINSGNSGGPLCNANGEVIGITSMKLVDTSVEGMGFAIPIETAIQYANKIEKGEKITQPYIGIAMLNVSDAYYYKEYYNLLNKLGVTSGVIVNEVEKNSPADKGGLKADDIIIKLNDNDISTIGYLRYYLYSYKEGDKVTFTVLRDGKEKKIDITLGTNSKTY